MAKERIVVLPERVVAPKVELSNQPDNTLTNTSDLMLIKATPGIDMGWVIGMELGTEGEKLEDAISRVLYEFGLAGAQIESYITGNTLTVSSPDGELDDDDFDTEASAEDYINAGWECGIIEDITGSQGSGIVSIWIGGQPLSGESRLVCNILFDMFGSLENAKGNPILFKQASYSPVVLEALAEATPRIVEAFQRMERSREA